MDKAIKQHEAFLVKFLSEKHSDAEREKILTYHEQQLTSFQHERLIHLLVTLFFGFLVVVSAPATILASYSEAFNPLALPLGILTLLLLVVELFYIFHYYKLENGVQRLYRYHDALYGIKK
jgi:uncharacterized protein YqhQ